MYTLIFIANLQYWEQTANSCCWVVQHRPSLSWREFEDNILDILYSWSYRDSQQITGNGWRLISVPRRSFWFSSEGNSQFLVFVNAMRKTSCGHFVQIGSRLASEEKMSILTEVTRSPGSLTPLGRGLPVIYWILNPVNQVSKRISDAGERGRHTSCKCGFILSTRLPELW